MSPEEGDHGRNRMTKRRRFKERLHGAKWAFRMGCLIALKVFRNQSLFGRHCLLLPMLMERQEGAGACGGNAGPCPKEGTAKRARGRARRGAGRRRAAFWSPSICFGGVTYLTSLEEENGQLLLQKLRIPGTHLSDLPHSCGWDASPADERRAPSEGRGVRGRDAEQHGPRPR